MYSTELIFLGLGYNDYNQAEIKIYDKDCLVIHKKTYNNKIKVCLKDNKRYLLVANGPYDNLVSKIIIIPGIKKYYYIFSNAYCNCLNNQSSEIVTFLLVDNNYANLPIEKGEMMVWQKQ